MIKQLLAPEIRRERNTALQCIRHIVKRISLALKDPFLIQNQALKNDCDVSPEICTNGEQSETSSGTQNGTTDIL